MPESATKPGGIVRKSAFSCEACRKRKVKCNGASPSCSRCAARGEVCVYSLTPTLSYTKSLESRIAELEAELEKLKKQSPPQREEARNLKVEDVDSGKLSATPLQERVGERSDAANASDLAGDIEGLKIEEDGRISFHGPTSLFQLPSGLAPENPNPVLTEQGIDGRKERLINNAWRERAFEQLTTIPEPFQYLLDSHWCWIHPLFNFVYRPAFTRDMKINGPYYSDVLLNAILSHSLRWCRSEPKIGHLLEAYDGGDQFRDAALTGLFESLKGGNGQIPIIQALLLLSAQECGRGNRTQAWLYSGMAFRLVEDLGITIDSRKYSSVQFSDEDIEIRNRLFWSCYFWDKLVSLYFGRSPIIQDTPVSPPRILLDDTAEIEIWTPHGVHFPEGVHYPPTQAHSTSCFMRMCSLSEILNQIIIHIYDPVRQSTDTQILNCVEEQGRNLEKWWNDLPPFLKLVVTNLPPYCPPSHIVTLNCIYHTTNILLHRPMLCSRQFRGSQHKANNANHLVQCLSSATSIIALYDLYRRTFGDAHVVLSVAYSLYTAASIFLLEIQALKYASTATIEKLRYCIVALGRVKNANPVINTALGLIDRELQKLHINISESNTDTQHINPTYTQSPPGTSSMDQKKTPSYTVPPHGAFSITPPPNPSEPHLGQIAQQSQPQQQQQQQQASHHEPQQQFPDTINIPYDTFSLDDSLPEPTSFTQDSIYNIAPELFEAFSYTEPIPTNVDPGFDASWTPPAPPGSIGGAPGSTTH
ncbi:hypothetical protein VTO42DRAFT_6171 [Malbranchea cinnamomea]